MPTARLATRFSSKILKGGGGGECASRSASANTQCNGSGAAQGDVKEGGKL